MYSSRSAAPLTINTQSQTESKPGLFTASATFRYDESATTTTTTTAPRRRTSVNNRPGSRQASHAGSTTSPRRQRTATNASMNSFTNGTTTIPPAMFVRALYDYDADDRTSLSFRKGDIIQVITQLESGWWDGIHSGIRGWFPSNYCAVIASPGDGDQGGTAGDDQESGTDDDLDDDRGPAAATTEQQQQRLSNGQRQQQQPQQQQPPQQQSQNGSSEQEQEEAAFWIPQATQDGRLFYYNTLTGVSTMELPLETPTSSNETGPRNTTNIYAPDQTRPPPEMMAGGYERDEDDTSASEAEDGMIRSHHGSLPRRRRGSYISDGVSPAASMESLNASPVSRARNDSRDFYRNAAQQGGVAAAVGGGSITIAGGVSVPSFANNLLGQYPSSTIPRSFFDDGTSPPVTWNRLVENMRKSVESYRQAISNCDRAEYVRKAEDISDHLRMLLAAGSGTTDNHSGNPSVISTNKALYPHFRDMMSRFSKLVLSSHIAAADFPAPDSYTKCLQEAEGVMNGVYGYVEIARAQRGEEIPRLIPGFVLGSYVGGNWQNNNLSSSMPRDPMMSTSFMDQDDYDSLNEPSAQLDLKLLERVDDLKRMIVSGIRRLEEHLVVPEKVINPARHEQLSNAICIAAGKVVELFRPYIAIVESINLSPFGPVSGNAQLTEFASQKQRLYDLVGSLVVACQTVAGPLADEWADVRGEPLETRVQDVRSITKQLENSTSQISFSMQGLLATMPAEPPQTPSSSTATRDVNNRERHRRTDGAISYEPSHVRNTSRARATRPPLTELAAQSHSYTEGVDPSTDAFRDKPKLTRFFGVSVQEEVPLYLRLDYENQIVWDKKVDPPQLRGGTLMALVEQLTRHDKLDTSFNTTFLLTYKSFTTASELFELLVKRFSIQPPRGITQDDYRTWVEKKQNPVRFRVVNILKNWFDSYWMEGTDEASMELLRRVYSFAKDSVATSSTPGSGPLITVIEQRLKGQDSNSKRMVLNLNSQAPTPIVPKNMKKLKFLDIDATEFARQLTIIESKLYGKIKPTECLSKTWQKKIGEGEPDPAPNVKALILHSNQLTNWVAEMILTQQDVKRRVVVIKHFVAVADKCRQLNNYSTLTSIISALGTAPIHRLNRTWNQVNARTTSTLETMRRLMGSTKNFAEYRETLHSANPPCIPFFGVYLTDLTFIEDGIPSVIKKSDLINFAKRTKTAEVIRDIQQYQSVPYPLSPVPELQDYILSNMQAAGDVHEMYDKSLAIEPREREDEKIARLLSESGFL